MIELGIYLYCAIPAGSVPHQGLAGLDGMQVRSLTNASIEYWYSRLARRPEPSIEGIREHNAVVEAAVTEQVTPLPLRFGQWFENEVQLRERIAPLHTLHTEKLNDFQGALEFGLRIVDPREQPPVHEQPTAVTSGRDYLLALRERQTLQLSTVAEAVAADVTAICGSFVRAEKVEQLKTAHGVISTAHLVPRPHFAAWRKAVDTLRQQYPELRFLASGPWPPYSFAV